MDGPPPDFRLLHFSSDRYPAEARRGAWQQILGRKLLAVDVEPLSDAPFSVQASLRLLEGLRFGTGVFSASINRRGRAIVREDNDDFALMINMQGAMSASQRGRDIEIEEGGAYLLSCAEDGVYSKPTHGALMLARFPHKAVASLAPVLYDKVARPIAPAVEALGLSTSYFRVLEDNQALPTPELRALVTRHVYDLIALLFNPSRDQAIASRGGVRAAQLNAIKTFVIANLPSSGISLAGVAASHRLSPRQVQRLFERDGLTFSEFVLRERLKAVYGELTDPLSTRGVSDIAYDYGFGDISNFNRAFRRRYGASPSDVRRPQTPCA